MEKLIELEQRWAKELEISGLAVQEGIDSPESLLVLRKLRAIYVEHLLEENIEAALALVDRIGL